MKIDELVCEISPAERRIALLSRGRLEGILIERLGGAGAVGGIHLGRVVRLLPGAAGALVEFGDHRPGFLSLGGAEAPPLHEGAAVLVQVQSEAREEKGAKLTRHVSLAGAYLAYSPFHAGFSLSGKIDDPHARQKLQAWLKAHGEAGEGIVVRTRAQEADVAELNRELAALRHRWAALERARGAAEPPACLAAAPDLLLKAALDHPEAQIIRLDDRESLARLKAELPAPLAAKLHFEEAPLFERLGIEAGIEAALAREIRLPSGGRLIFDRGAVALTVDVDSGGDHRSDARQTANREAAAEIARQLRLRNVGGRVLVDFIPEGKRGRNERGGSEARQPGAQDALTAALAEDPVPARITGWTPLGLVEILRERRGAALDEAMLAPAGTRWNAETVAAKALRRILAESLAQPAKRFSLVAAPEVIALLEGPFAEARRAVERRLGHAVLCWPEPGHPADSYDLVTDHP